MIRKNLIFLLIVFLSACTAKQKASETVLNKDLKEFNIEFDYAFPKPSSRYIQGVQDLNLSRTGNSANRINIKGDGYYLKFKNDSVSGVLPFYGEQYFGYQKTVHDRIEFKTATEELNISTEIIKKGTRVKFKIKDSNRNFEEYQMRILIFENNKAEVVVLSSTRSSIAYRGKLFIE